MIYKKILSGSREFFPTGNNDYDYIIIQDQQEQFKYVRRDNNCYFEYKKMTKDEYFKWHKDENVWYLNFAPLVNQEFLEYMQIDIFDKDYQEVFNIMQKVVKYNSLKSINALDKYIYRNYIYQRYIMNGHFRLSEEELINAQNLKNKVYTSKKLLKDLFSFFQLEDLFYLVVDNLKFNKGEIEVIEKWFNEYFDYQLIQVAWQDDYKPSYDKLLNKQYASFSELKKQANLNRKRLVELKTLLGFEYDKKVGEKRWKKWR